jgi:hypothetical protein
LWTDKNRAKYNRDQRQIAVIVVVAVEEGAFLHAGASWAPRPFRLDGDTGFLFIERHGRFDHFVIRSGGLSRIVLSRKGGTGRDGGTPTK